MEQKKFLTTSQKYAIIQIQNKKGIDTMYNEEKKTMYFDRPAQVIFSDEEGHWSAGIAYKDEVICGCCGGVFPIDEIEEHAKEKGSKKAIHTLNWVNITQEIFDNYVDDKDWEE